MGKSLDVVATDAGSTHAELALQPVSAKGCLMKVSRRKRRLALRLRTSGRNVIEERKASLEAEVARGLRDARTLVSIPVDLARNSTVHFPRHPFGEPEPW